MLKKEIEDMKSKHEDEALLLKSKILEYDAYIKDIIKEYQDKENEL